MRPLTERQEQVVRLVLEGASTKKIGEALQISAETVNVHLRAIRDRLGSTLPPKQAIVRWHFQRQQEGA